MEYENWYKNVTNIVCDSISYLKSIDKNDNTTVVFDIDDTLIHNKGFAILPVVMLYKYVKSLGMKTVIITYRGNNKEALEFTKNQLASFNINGYSLLYCRPEHIVGNVDPFFYKKECRRDAVNRKHEIVMSIGDKSWDIGDYGGKGYIIPVL